MKNKYEGLTKEDIIYVNNLDWRDYKEHLISQIVLRNKIQDERDRLAKELYLQVLEMQEHKMMFGYSVKKEPFALILNKIYADKYEQKIASLERRILKLQPKNKIKY